MLCAHPTARATPVDLSRSVARSPAAFEDMADRVTFSGQSFFDPLPLGADLYPLKSVLGD